MDLLLIATIGDNLPEPQVQRQIRRLAEHLNNSYHVDVIYSSPTPSANNLATLIAEPRQLAVYKSQAIREFDGGLVGSLAGDSSNYPSRDFSHSLHFHPRGGESELAVFHRLATFCGTLEDYHSNHSVALVTQGPIISILLRHMLGFHIGAKVDLTPAPCSISHIHRGENYIRMLSFSYLCP